MTNAITMQLNGTHFRSPGRYRELMISNIIINDDVDSKNNNNNNIHSFGCYDQNDKIWVPVRRKNAMTSFRALSRQSRPLLMINFAAFIDNYCANISPPSVTNARDKSVRFDDIITELSSTPSRLFL